MVPDVTGSCGRLSPSLLTFYIIFTYCVLSVPWVRVGVTIFCLFFVYLFIFCLFFNFVLLFKYKKRTPGKEAYHC